METISVCESCYAMNSGMEPSYWDGDPEGYARSEAGWIAHHKLAISPTYAEDDPEGHGYPIHGFASGPCAICKSTMGGNYYDCTYSWR